MERLRPDGLVLYILYLSTIGHGCILVTLQKGKSPGRKSRISPPKSVPVTLMGCISRLSVARTDYLPHTTSKREGLFQFPVSKVSVPGHPAPRQKRHAEGMAEKHRALLCSQEAEYHKTRQRRESGSGSESDTASKLTTP